MLQLKKVLSEKIPAHRERVTSIAKQHGDKKVGEVNASQLIGGMRGIKCLLCDTSYLDPQEGIRFRGYTIPETRKKLPTDDQTNEPYPIGIWYLLLTGDIPSREAVEELNNEIRKRQQLPQYVIDVLRALPADAHPMMMFSSAILSMQRESEFVRQYNAGMTKDHYWDPTFEDSLTLLARLPMIAAYIYRRKYKGDTHIAPDPKMEWGFNFAHMMGVEKHEYKNLMRLYLLLHCDHESGNVSAHTSHLVASALSDIYYAVSAGINGLAGPLHGLANQECLRWILELMDHFGGVPSKEQVEKYAWDTLNSGQVIPGYGHAVLRVTDPRFMAQREFAQKFLPDDPIFKSVSNVYEVVPDVLQKHGKAKNPWPNVDAHSGCLQYHYGVTETDFYTVLFGVSRAMGMTSQGIIARGLGLPIERPKSITTDMLSDIVGA